jgi:pimeloyl-ACP methyl ester carboxylesterase
MRFILLNALSLWTLLIPVDLAGQVKSITSSSALDVSLDTGTGALSGTLTTPDGKERMPVVLIVPGSGPTDRDGNSPLGVQANTYKMLADDLAARGIATLRYDKRGIRKSAEAMTSEADMRFEHGIADAAGWVRWLKKDKRFSKVIVLGHSEGSLIGMEAAKDAHVDAFVSAAGPGRPADQLLREQLAKQLPPDLMAESNRMLDSLVAGKTIPEPNPVLAALFRPSVQPYLISWFKYDPAKVIGELRMPVLILQGTTDLQVSTEEARLLAAGHPAAQLMLIEGMNHVLKAAPADAQKNLLTYSDPVLPLMDGLVSAVVSFIEGVK